MTTLLSVMPPRGGRATLAGGRLEAGNQIIHAHFL
jgi:hypothetical protein